MLLQQLTEAMRAMTQLESQLKTLSASTLSMSSSSSLGSLSSSHASSKGSLSSLSFTDIYGLSTTTVASNETSASDLKKVLQQPQLQPQRSTVQPAQEFLSSSQQSLSPHSSLTSLSPPVTPMEAGYARPPPLRLSTIDESSNQGLEYLLQKNRSNDSGAPLSPLEPPSHGLTASSESVAGDSGVFEATSPTKNLPPSDAEKLTSLMAAMSFDSAQVQIKMRYDREDSLLQIGIERARNLRTLVLKPNRQLYLKVSLVPSVSPSNWSFTTQPVQADANETPVLINETFPVAVPKSKLSTKTLQVTIWTASEDATCVGSTQISLADFDWDSVSMRWYNILSLQFTMLAQPKKAAASGLYSQGQTLKEESSDDSTIISSQASTLTRSKAMALQVFEDLDEADIVIPSEPAFETSATAAFMKQPKTESKETNTECVFVKPPTGGGGQSAGGARPKVKDLVKRSKTFNYNSKASAEGQKANYTSNVKLNRSDSDGAMPLYRKLPFQHNHERRSLRLPTKFNLLPNDHKIVSTSKKACTGENPEVTKLQLKRSRRLARTKEHVMETPLDLELDLAAQKTKLELLQSDIARLREIQCKLEEAKSQHSAGNSGANMDSWLQDCEYDEYLQNLLSKVRKQTADL